MRWLLDQGIPRSAAELLRLQGEDAVHTGEIAMATAEDAAILERAHSEGRVVVTLDADFHQLLAMTGVKNPSTVRVRIQGLKAEAFAELLLEIAVLCGDDLKRGAALSVTEENVRIRILPLP